MAKCEQCNGTGRCQQCKGTEHFGYPGYGKTDMYPSTCNFCQTSGVCRSCFGKGEK